jgi:hypothetical protein
MENKVIKAQFGSVQRNMDVTTKVAEYWKNGAVFKVSPGALLCDPCLNDSKFLTVTWTSNGVEYTKRYPEATAVFPFPPA